MPLKQCAPFILGELADLGEYFGQSFIVRLLGVFLDDDKRETGYSGRLEQGA